jgi:hypothetical protein
MAISLGKDKKETKAGIIKQRKKTKKAKAQKPPKAPSKGTFW